MDTTAQVSEQAASAGDVQTSQEGQLPDGVLASGSLTAASNTTPPETLTPKNVRKSDSEWQEAQEAKKLAPELETKVTKLSKEIERLEFEKKHPVVDEYAEQWNEMNKDPRFEAFSFEERLNFIHKPDTKAVKADLANQAAKTEGSVMGSSRPAPQAQGPIVPESASSWFGSEKEANEAYAKYDR